MVQDFILKGAVFTLPTMRLKHQKKIQSAVPVEKILPVNKGLCPKFYIFYLNKNYKIKVGV